MRVKCYIEGIPLRVAYNLVKEIKAAYDGVERNKKLLQDLRNGAESIEKNLKLVQKWQHAYVEQQSFKEVLEEVRTALNNAKHVMIIHGAPAENVKGKIGELWNEKRQGVR